MSPEEELDRFRQIGRAAMAEAVNNRGRMTDFLSVLKTKLIDAGLSINESFFDETIRDCETGVK